MTAIRSYILTISCLFAALAANGQVINKLWDYSIGSSKEHFFIQYSYPIDKDTILLIATIESTDTIFTNTDSIIADTSFGLRDIALVWLSPQGKFYKHRIYGGDNIDFIADFIADSSNYWLLLNSQSSTASGNINIINPDSSGIKTSQLMLLQINLSGKLMDSKIFKNGGVGSKGFSMLQTNKNEFIICEEPAKHYANKNKKYNRIFKYSIKNDSIQWKDSTLPTFSTRFGWLSHIGKSKFVLGENLKNWRIYNQSNGFLLLDTTYNGKIQFYGTPHYLQESSSVIHLAKSSLNKGGIKSEDGRGLFDYWLVNIDQNGIIKWDKTLGGSFDEGSATLSMTISHFMQKQNNILELKNKNTLFSGSSKSNKSGDKSEDRRGGSDYWIMLLDSNGQLLADKTFGSQGDDILLGLLPNGQNRYIVWGYSNGDKGFDRTDTAMNTNGDNWLVGFCIAPPKELNISDSSLCVGDSLLIQAAEGYRYRWNTGDTTAQIWVHKSDSYHVEIFGENGCNTLSDTAIIQFYNYPDGSISTNNDTSAFCTGDSLQLIAPIGFKQYYWSNGDSTASTWINSQGTYYLQLLENAYCSAIVDSININEVAKPKAQFSIQSIHYQCDSVLVTLTDSSLFANKNLTTWHFGDASLDTTLAQHYYYQNGTYTLQQWVSNKACADSSFDTLSIAFAPTIASKISLSNSGACTPDTVFFNLPDSAIIDSIYLHIADTSLKVQKQHQHVFSNEGIYTITQSIFNSNGCVTFDSLSYTAFPQPIAQFSIFDSSATCGKKTFYLYNQSQPKQAITANNQFTYWLNDSLVQQNISVEDTVSIIVNTDEKQSISLLHQIAHCNDSFALNIRPQIDSFPKAIAQISTTGFCAPDSLMLINLSQNTDSFYWRINQQKISSNKPITNLYIDSAQQLEIQLFAHNSSGCIDSLTKPLIVDVLAIPKTTFHIEQEDVCPPFQVDVKLDKQQTNSVEYQWLLDGNDSFNYKNDFSFRINSYKSEWQLLTLVSKNAYCSDTFGQVIETRPIPEAQFSLSDSAFCFPNSIVLLNESRGADSIFWYGFNLDNPNADTLIFKPDNIGEQNIALKAFTQYACSDSSIMMAFVHPKPDATFSILPNSGCAPLDVDVTLHQENLMAFTYQWRLNGKDTFQHKEDFNFTLEKSEKSLKNNSLELVLYNDYCSDTAAQSIILEGTEPIDNADIAFATVADSVVELAWKKQKNAVNYLLERFYQDEWSELIQTKDTFYTDSEVQANTSYQYRILAIDSCGNQGENGNMGEPMPLTAALKHPSKQVQLDWTPYQKWTDGVNHYQVQQWNGTNFQTIDSTQSTTYTTATSKLLSSDNWLFRVIAFAKNGTDSSASWPAQINTTDLSYIPNAFSPNGDGINDLFKVVLPNNNAFDIKIYNRWGSLIFTGNESQHWDGTFKGTTVPLGNYLYVIKSNSQDFTGIVSVIE